MTDLRKAAEMALEALDCLPWQASPIAVEATQALRRALAMENFSEVNQELEQALAQPPVDWKAVAAIAMNKIEKREWVGLTVDEILETLPSSEWKADVTLIFAKAIEAKLKEKNT